MPVVCLFIAMLLALSSCTNIQANYYTQTINSWRGANINTLVRVWGKPDKKLSTLGGSTVYVYKKQEYRMDSPAHSPAIGVNNSPGRSPVITTHHQTPWQNGMTVFCITAFEVNNEGTIVNTQTQGNNCFADSKFMQERHNPG